MQVGQAPPQIAERRRRTAVPLGQGGAHVTVPQSYGEWRGPRHAQRPQPPARLVVVTPP